MEKSARVVQKLLENTIVEYELLGEQEKVYLDSISIMERTVDEFESKKSKVVTDAVTNLSRLNEIMLDRYAFGFQAAFLYAVLGKLGQEAQASFNAKIERIEKEVGGLRGRIVANSTASVISRATLERILNTGRNFTNDT